VSRWLRRLLWTVGGASAAAVLGFAAGAAITDRLEQDNRFCLACHRQEKPLHWRIYASFYPEDGKLVTLAAAHNVDARIKCIDCHIGADRKDYVIIKAIAAWDTARWLVGSYRDPEALRYPLGDRTCLKCHPGGGQNAEIEKAFHNAPYHRDPRNACSECHPSHPEAPAETRFLQAAVVKPRCDGCHQAILGIPGR
jgi:hypothetical protein